MGRAWGGVTAQNEMETTAVVAPRSNKKKLNRTKTKQNTTKQKKTSRRTRRNGAVRKWSRVTTWFDATGTFLVYHRRQGLFKSTCFPFVCVCVCVGDYWKRESQALLELELSELEPSPGNFPVRGGIIRFPLIFVFFQVVSRAAPALPSQKKRKMHNKNNRPQQAKRGKASERWCG